MKRTITLDEDDVKLICKLLRAYGNRQLLKLVTDLRAPDGGRADRLDRLGYRAALAAVLVARIENQLTDLICPSGQNSIVN